MDVSKQNNEIIFKNLESTSLTLRFSPAHDPTNCKLSYLHGLGTLGLAGVSNEEKLKVINHLLCYCKGTVIINTINKELFNFIKGNFQYYYAEEVPIGYNNSYQYHICIRNLILPNSYCRQPEVKPQPTIDKEAIKTKLLTLLKKKRRKSDYVQEFIDSLL